MINNQLRSAAVAVSVVRVGILITDDDEIAILRQPAFFAVVVVKIIALIANVVSEQTNLIVVTLAVTVFIAIKRWWRWVRSE